MAGREALVLDLSEQREATGKAEERAAEAEERADYFRLELQEERAEVQALHHKLVSKYVNFTLIAEDASRFAGDVTEMAGNLAEEANHLVVEGKRRAQDASFVLGQWWYAARESYESAAEVVVPMYESAAEVVVPMYESAAEVVTPVATSLLTDARTQYGKAKEAAGPTLRKLGKGYREAAGPHVRRAREVAVGFYSEHLRSVVEGRVVPAYREHGAPLLERAGGAMGRSETGAVSALRQTARSFTEYQKGQAEGGQITPKQEKIIGTLRWIDENAQTCVRAAALFPLAFVAFYFFGSWIWSIVLLPFRLAWLVLWLALLPLRIVGMAVYKVSGRDTEGKGQGRASKQKLAKNTADEAMAQ